MPSCNYQPVGDAFVCSVCGDRQDRPAQRDCPGRPPPPSKGGKLGRYASAVSRWVAAGRPVRSEEEIQRIYDTCCRPCEHFDPQKGTCKICGCRVRRNGAALLNKIKMATEHCPIRQW